VSDVETVLRTEQTARKRYACDWGCGAPIEPGKRYVRSSYPPHTDPNDSDHWVSYRLHGSSLYQCPVYTPWIENDEHPAGSDKHRYRSSITVESPPRTKDNIMIRIALPTVARLKTAARDCYRTGTLRRLGQLLSAVGDLAELMREDADKRGPVDPKDYTTVLAAIIEHADAVSTALLRKPAEETDEKEAIPA
jgi:hypothetical protein